MSSSPGQTVQASLGPGPSCLVVCLAVLPGKVPGLQRNVVQPPLTILQESSLV